MPASGGRIGGGPGRQRREVIGRGAQVVEGLRGEDRPDPVGELVQGQPARLGVPLQRLDHALRGPRRMPETHGSVRRDRRQDGAGDLDEVAGASSICRPRRPPETYIVASREPRRR